MLQVHLFLRGGRSLLGLFLLGLVRLPDLLLRLLSRLLLPLELLLGLRFLCPDHLLHLRELLYRFCPRGGRVRRHALLAGRGDLMGALSRQDAGPASG